MKDIECLLLVLICVVCFAIGFTVGLGVSVSRMKHESLVGYVAKATYSTNEFGEVSIKTVTWEKK